MTPGDAAALAGAISERVTEYVEQSGRGREAFPSLVLRALKQARYDPRNLGHMGLASRAYCHFTSPIRRYPDLVCHRALLHELGVSDEPVAPDDLFEVAERISETERAAAKLEHRADDICLAWLLERELFGRGWEEPFDGEITGVIGSGVFVRFGEVYEGYVPARRLEGDYYELNELGTAWSAAARDAGSASATGSASRSSQSTGRTARWSCRRRAGRRVAASQPTAAAAASTHAQAALTRGSDDAAISAGKAATPIAPPSERADAAQPSAAVSSSPLATRASNSPSRALSARPDAHWATSSPAGLAAARIHPPIRSTPSAGQTTAGARSESRPTTRGAASAPMPNAIAAGATHARPYSSAASATPSRAGAAASAVTANAPLRAPACRAGMTSRGPRWRLTRACRATTSVGTSESP